MLESWAPLARMGVGLRPFKLQGQRAPSTCQVCPSLPAFAEMRAAVVDVEREPLRVALAALEAALPHGYLAKRAEVPRACRALADSPPCALSAVRLPRSQRLVRWNNTV